MLGIVVLHDDVPDDLVLRVYVDNNAKPLHHPRSASTLTNNAMPSAVAPPKK